MGTTNLDSFAMLCKSVLLKLQVICGLKYQLTLEPHSIRISTSTSPRRRPKLAFPPQLNMENSRGHFDGSV